MSPDKSTLDALRIDRNAPASQGPWMWILVLAGILAAAGLGLFWFFNRPVPLAVRTQMVRDASADSGQRTVLNASGYVVARREATVSSKITAKVVDVLVEEGMKVAEGQVLANLDDVNTKANLRLAEAQSRASQAALDETKVRLEEAQRELERISRLAQEQVASAAELDRAKAEVDSLQARLDRQTVEVTVAERQVALWQEQMEDTIIRAPFTGVVTSKNAQPGEMISPISAGGGFTRTGICTIVDMNSLEIEVDVNESYINRVEEGQSVEAALDAYADWKIPCKVIAIVPTADRQKATVRVRVGFEKLDTRILPQMGVKVAFRSSEDAPAPRQALVIPKSSVQRNADGQETVWLLDGGRAARRIITAGASRGDDVTVLSGLVTGDKIIVDPPAELAEGAAVKEQ